MANEQNLKKFSSTYQPKKNGRKPKLYTIASKGYNLSLDEFRGVAQYLMQLPRDEVKRIGEDNQTPIWMSAICRALYKDTSAGNMRALNELTERLWGKAHQGVDITSKGKEIVPEPIIINMCTTKEDIKEECTDGEEVC